MKLKSRRPVLLTIFYLISLLAWAYALNDIYNRQAQNSNAWKMRWAAIVLILPPLGSMLYFLQRPRAISSSKSVGRV